MQEGKSQEDWRLEAVDNGTDIFLLSKRKLTNISEVYVTFDIWLHGLMVTCNYGYDSLRENIHAQDPYCVKVQNIKTMNYNC